MIQRQTARLRLRAPELRDGAFLIELYNDPDFLRFIGDRGLRTQDDVASFLAERGSSSGDLGLVLVERLTDGERVGICSLKHRPYLDDPDLGFAFLPAHRARGYAEEASRAVLEMARDDLGLERVVAIVTPANVRSIALLGRLGFREEGTVRPPGDPEDLALYVWSAG